MLILGNIYLQRKGYKDASLILTKLNDLNPYIYQVHLMLAICYIFLKEYDSSVTHLEQSSLLYPFNYNFLGLSCIIFIEKNQKETADLLFTTILQQEYIDPIVLQMVAQKYFEISNLGQSAKCYKKLIEINEYL